MKKWFGQCRPDVALMSCWKIGIMYHGKMQHGKDELTPATHLVIFTDMTDMQKSHMMLYDVA